MSIVAAVTDDEILEKAIAPFSANDRFICREIRAAVDRLMHVGDEATRFAEALAREHANILLEAKELSARTSSPSNKRRRRHANDHGSLESLC